ncbi:hypothetical protein [Senegalia massiliensis]|uniref:Uncharacterized protein n=1 Tax=Senegalia massiliensis TaxID=1720316 RepID=A0A845R5Q7_9CLOT|nr:hypothetical protein [Senegalia massiliensis]NBI07843.1 hypothetical protein [Senegalia massiliensis]
MKKITKTQIVTLLLIISWIIWEYRVSIWAKDEIGAIIRIDLLFIIPIILIMSFISIRQFIKRK